MRATLSKTGEQEPGRDTHVLSTDNINGRELRVAASCWFQAPAAAATAAASTSSSHFTSHYYSAAAPVSTCNGYAITLGDQVRHVFLLSSLSCTGIKLPISRDI